jgi:acid phosphatase type 7
MKQNGWSNNVSTRWFKLLAMIVLLVVLFSLPDSSLLSGHSGVVKAAGDPVIAAAGDIACDPTDPNFNGGNGSSASCRQKYTSDLLVNANPAAVLDLGDTQYYCGGYQAFVQSYDLSWGRLKSITHPAVGNHEFLTSGGTGCTAANAAAAGYFQYFGAAAGNPGQGYYSYDIGAWHLIALNSNCSDAGGCGATTPQGKWLEADLTAHPNVCVLAYWHIPLFSSGTRANNNSKPFWTALYAHNTALILVGHDHMYERFAPQTPAGAADPARGIRQFTVGTGGSDHTSVAKVAANSQVRNTNTFGVLLLTLHPTSYDWQFVPEAGKTFTDSGTGTCSGGSAATATPTNIPTNTPTPTLAVSPTPGNTPTSTNTPSVTFTPTATQSGSSVTFVPMADAYVYSVNPDTKFGTVSTLRADASPSMLSFLKFSVSGLSGAPSQATLRLFANSIQSTGVDVHHVADTTWGETTITYNNMPAYDAAIAGSSGPIKTSGTFYSINVTSLITGNGTFNMAFTTTNSTTISFASRESGANAPQLVITP